MHPSMGQSTSSSYSRPKIHVPSVDKISLPSHPTIVIIESIPNKLPEEQGPAQHLKEEFSPTDLQSPLTHFLNKLEYKETTFTLVKQ